MQIVTTAEMRLLEQEAVDAGCPVERLMERAAQGVATTILTTLLPDQHRRVVVLAGPGNNGGDALLAGQLLASAGCHVSLRTWSRSRPAPVGVTLPTTPMEARDMPKLRAVLAEATLVLDGLLGTGHNRPVTGVLREILRAIPRTRGVVAVDVPTGVDSDTGQADDDSVRAELTVALGLAKPGLLLQPGAAHAGRIVCVPLGLPLEPTAIVRGEWLDDAFVAGLLPSRPADANKGTSGKLLVIAGSEQYTGAPHLSATAAARAGAGLVTLAVTRAVYMMVATRGSEATFALLPHEDEGSLGPKAIEPLLRLAERYDVFVVGPGLGQAPATQQAVLQLASGLRAAPRSPRLVVDADALNALAGQSQWWELLPEGGVVTPHPGEMGRLLRMSVPDVQADRVTVARSSARLWRQVVVLKGAGTVVAAPDGRWGICSAAVPALATAGTGDVLAGTIAGLLAQGMEPYEGAASGVLVHARAGQQVAEVVGDAGLLATDLLDQLPIARRRLQGR